MGKQAKKKDRGSSKSLSSNKNESHSQSKYSKSKKANQKQQPKRTRMNAQGQIQEYINSKICQICNLQDKQEQMLLCDRCDDSYHQSCLIPPMQQLPEEEWICPVCQDQLQQLQNNKRNNMEKQNETQCYRCQEQLGRRQVIKGRDINNNTVQIQCKSLVDLTCLYCQHSFHNICFSERKNSLNCSKCQKQIRRKGPKSHDEFMKYIEKSIESVTHSDYRILQPGMESQNEETHKYQRLKIPNFMSTWQFIVQNQASLYYAFFTKGLTFVDQQIYHNEEKEQLMQLNNPNRDVQGKILRLHPRDEKAYEQFKINSKNGYVGPFEVKQDRIKGFYLTATDYVEPFTIVSEYVGEVMRSRQAFNYQQNDSIFLLMRGARSKESLDIVPQRYGNISRFFSGINNNLKRSAMNKLQNIKSLRFNYKGRVRLILRTIKPIQAGQTLYFDYNGSAFHEYPTDHFTT